MTPFEIISLILSAGSLLGSLFGGGGGDDQTQTTKSETTPSKYRSPALGMMEPGILSALLGNAQALGGAGMPGGVSRFGSGANSMFSDIIGLLSKEWPTIMSEYGKPKTDPAVAKGVACEQKCRHIIGTDETSYRNCYRQCMNP